MKVDHLTTLDLSPEQRAALLIVLLPEQIDQLCISRLRARGYSICKPRRPESPTALCLRLKISRSKLWRRWKRYPRLKADLVEIGPNGRTIAFVSNVELDLFLKGPPRVRRILVSQIAKLSLG